MMTHDFAFLSTKIKSGLLAPIALSQWIFISQINLTSSSSTTPSGQCLYLFSFFFKVMLLAQFRMDQFCHGFSYTHAALVFYISYISELHTYYMLHSFSPVTTHAAQLIFRCLVNFIICIICPQCLFLCSTYRCFSLYFEITLHHFQNKSLSISSEISRTNCPYILF